MDEYLSEKEQIERIREWWRENGWYLIGGAALALGGYLGYDQYQAYRDQQAEEASAVYAQLRQTLEEDRPGAEELLAQLIADYGSSPYTDQARLLMAEEFLISDTDRAASELRTVVDTSRDRGLAMVARMRLARVLAYRQQYDDALAVLEAEAPGEFAAQIRAIEGDIHVLRGAPDDARRAYTQALTTAGAAGLDRSLIQMKLGELPTPDIGLPASDEIVTTTDEDSSAAPDRDGAADVEAGAADETPAPGDVEPAGGPAAVTGSPEDDGAP